MKIPVLQIHGLNDRAAGKVGLRDSWNYVEKDYTLVSVLYVGDDPHHDTTELVNSTMRIWIDFREQEHEIGASRITILIEE